MLLNHAPRRPQHSVVKSANCSGCVTIIYRGMAVFDFCKITLNPLTFFFISENKYTYSNLQFMQNTNTFCIGNTIVSCCEKSYKRSVLNDFVLQYSTLKQLLVLTVDCNILFFFVIGRKIT